MSKGTYRCKQQKILSGNHQMPDIRDGDHSFCMIDFDLNLLKFSLVFLLIQFHPFSFIHLKMVMGFRQRHYVTLCNRQYCIRQTYMYWMEQCTKPIKVCYIIANEQDRTQINWESEWYVDLESTNILNIFYLKNPFQEDLFSRLTDFLKILENKLFSKFCRSTVYNSQVFKSNDLNLEAVKWW